MITRIKSAWGALTVPQNPAATLRSRFAWAWYWLTERQP